MNTPSIAALFALALALAAGASAPGQDMAGMPR